MWDSSTEYRHCLHDSVCYFGPDKNHLGPCPNPSEKIVENIYVCVCVCVCVCVRERKEEEVEEEGEQCRGKDRWVRGLTRF